MVSFQDLQTAQQGMSREDLANAAQAATLPSLSTNPLALNNTAPTPNAGSTNPMAFGNAITQMLQKAQQVGTHTAAQVQTGQLNYSDAGLKASNAQLTNPALQGYAPSTIMNAGANAQAPFQTGAQGLQQNGQTFNEQLGNFGDALNNAKSLMQEYQAQQEKAKADAQDVVHQAIAAGSTAVDALIKSNPELFKLAGYDVGTLSGISQALRSQESQSDKTNTLAKGYPFYKYAGSNQVFDARTNQPVDYNAYKSAGGVGQPGDDHFADVMEVGSSSGSKLLTVTEAARLGVPYGTTQEEAAALSKTPSFGKASTRRGTSPTPSPTPTKRFVGPTRPTTAPTSKIRVSAFTKAPTANNVRNWLLSNYHKYAGQPYWEIWGAAADSLRNQGIDPAKLDKTFWDVFRPGEYDANHKKSTTGSSSNFDNL